MIFRFDDISLNTDMPAALAMAEHARSLGVRVWFCVSPLCHSDAGRERVFPAIFKALSDQTCFYTVDRAGVPEIPSWIERVSHGLIHLDHRLLDAGAQEMSIVTSCRLIGARRFVPPFNKWNAPTLYACEKNGIELIRFEDGWYSMEHEAYKEGHEKWYLHPRAFTAGGFKAWFRGGKGRNDRLDTST